MLAESFAHFLKRPLLAAADESPSAEALYHAPFALLAHGTQAEPLFCYANLTAQTLFGYSWDEMVGLPSRLSAEAEVQSEREKLLARAREHGYIDDYSGIRIRQDGKRFRVRDVVLWNLQDTAGRLHGQAALLNHWEWI